MILIKIWSLITCTRIMISWLLECDIWFIDSDIPYINVTLDFMSIKPIWDPKCLLYIQFNRTVPHVSHCPTDPNNSFPVTKGLKITPFWAGEMKMFPFSPHQMAWNWGVGWEGQNRQACSGTDGGKRNRAFTAWKKISLNIIPLIVWTLSYQEWFTTFPPRFHSKPIPKSIQGVVSPGANLVARIES